MSEPLDEVEVKQSVRGVAQMTRVYYEELIQQGFSNAEAMSLTVVYIGALMSATKG